MATATPVTSTASDASATAEGRLIDPRGQRFGAGLSVVILVVGFLVGLPIVMPFLMVALGVSALFGTRYSILGRPWPAVRSLLRLGPPAELEHEYPPRFAQALGTVGLAISTIFLIFGLTLLAWIVAAAVAALQALLALTGYCVGCRLYFLKWWLPAQFQRLARKTTAA